MHIQSSLVRPSFQDRKLVRIDDALENFKLLAARLARNFRAPSFVEFRELRTFAWRGIDSNDQSN
jgi:hypothetical protein